ncbi:MAG: NAD(P)-dependent oxidoreductase, partial [Bacteroidales bacterium]|nr:NAD(P)-dependent oxidoreductase [Bacteroidales bacterium]
MVCWASEQIALATLKLSTLNRDKYKILRQRNWRCDVTGAERDFGFKASVSLAEGLHRAIEWYRSAGWL